MNDIRSLTQALWQKQEQVEDTTPPIPTAVNFAAVLREMKSTPNSNNMAGLKKGSTGDSVVRLQKILQKWNPSLPHGPTGVYDDSTAKAMALYKAIYGGDSKSEGVDPKSADYLGKMENGTFWNDPPTKTPGQKLLYEAAQHLGKPYRLGADGNQAMDCGMLTCTAGNRTGGTDNLSRNPDGQFKAASEGQNGLKLSKTPKAGDLMFYRIPSSQSATAYSGVTHVGLYIDDKHILAASAGAGKVTIQEQEPLKRFFAGTATPTGAASHATPAAQRRSLPRPT